MVDGNGTVGICCFLVADIMQCVNISVYLINE